MPSDSPPPLYTVLVDLTGWSLDRTSAFPKSHRFTFAQRIDNLCLDAVLLSTRARFAERGRQSEPLRELNLRLEQLRVLWRLAHDRGWLSRQQLVFVNERIDEAGRMTGGWIRSLGRNSAPV